MAKLRIYKSKKRNYSRKNKTRKTSKTKIYMP